MFCTKHHLQASIWLNNDRQGLIGKTEREEKLKKNVESIQPVRKKAGCIVFMSI